MQGELVTRWEARYYTAEALIQIGRGLCVVADVLLDWSDRLAEWSQRIGPTPPVLLAPVDAVCAFCGGTARVVGDTTACGHCHTCYTMNATGVTINEWTT